VWLDAEKTSPYEFFQYWRNVADADVIKCLKMLTFVPVEEIEEMEKTMEGAQFNKAKELLAYELTKLVHGEEEAEKAMASAKALFGGSGSDENMPTVEIDSAELNDGGIGLLTLVVKAGLAPSVSEARRLVQQGGITANDEKMTDGRAIIKLDGDVIIRKGKKAFRKITVK
ncbi:MAG: tyrosine--tRNA ligase, partial [Ruminococcus sp.]|nr:tyrosine--tRNA ligase [Ruminococcus sp.]